MLERSENKNQDYEKYEAEVGPVISSLTGLA